MKGSVVSPANIAMIKHWGLEYGEPYPTPLAGSVSFNLSECVTHTTVQWGDGEQDEIFLGETFLDSKFYPRADAAYAIIDAARELLGFEGKVAYVMTKNSFPTGAGIASSASGFSALAGACLAAGGIDISTKAGRQQVIDVCAYGGSVSALRSIVDGWGQVGYNPETQKYNVVSLGSASHWDLVDLVVVLNSKPKNHGSADGHMVAETSSLQDHRIREVKRHLQSIGALIFNQDFSGLARMSEKEARMMVTVMNTTTPPISYSLPQSWEIIRKVEELRRQGVDVFWTIDAGANPHIITTAKLAKDMKKVLEAVKGVEQVIENKPCVGTRVTDKHLF